MPKKREKPIPISYAPVPENLRGKTTAQIRRNRRLKAAAILAATAALSAVGTDQSINLNTYIERRMAGKKADTAFGNAIAEARKTRNVRPGSHLSRGYTPEYDTKLSPKVRQEYDTSFRKLNKAVQQRSLWEKHRGKIAGGAAALGTGTMASAYWLAKRRKRK